jgi:tripartite-type tricarboxylate transporter receptor subunit TctC
MKDTRMRLTRTFRFASLGFSFACALAPLPAAAQDAIADFYKGKTLRIVIGYGPGGGYDIYGRVFAEHFGRYLPGNPTVVAQNMAGAGSFIAAKYMYSVAPQDGTAFGSLAQTLPLDYAMSTDQKDLDASKMPYIGRMVSNVDLGSGVPGATFKDIEDARRREIVVGATGAASPGYLLPMALNAYGRTKFKVIYGYKGSNDVLLAAERKEVDLIGSIGIATTMVRNPDWLLEKKAPMLYQAALTRHPLAQHVPALPELAESADGKAVLTAIAASADIGRSIITTPNVPAARLAALRKAFNAMMADAGFVEAMKKRNIILEPLTGEQVDKISSDTLRTPPNVLALVQKLVTTK